MEDNDVMKSMVVLVTSSRMKSPICKWELFESQKLVNLILVYFKDINPFHFLDSCDMMGAEILIILEDSNIISQEQIFNYIKDGITEKNIKLLIKLLKKDFFSPIIYTTEVSCYN